MSQAVYTQVPPAQAAGLRKSSLDAPEAGSVSVPSSPAVNRFSSSDFSAVSEDIFAFGADDYNDIQEQDTGVFEGVVFPHVFPLH